MTTAKPRQRAELHRSDSTEQRNAETCALRTAGRELGVELLPRRLQLRDARLPAEVAATVNAAQKRQAMRNAPP